MSKNSPGGRRSCTICGAEGNFLTPIGLMCRRDAFAAASQETAEDHSWIPVPVKEPDNAPTEATKGARIG